MNLKNRVAQVSGLALAAALPVISFAQTTTDPFDSAVTDVTSKVQTYGAALVGLAAVGVVFMIAIKYVKKIRSAA